MKVLRESDPAYADNLRTRVVRVGSVEFGGERPVVIAGPCAVESRAQTLEIAREVRDAGGDVLRGGAFKPRTSPYSFQGLGERGLEILAEAREATGLPVVTEVLDPRLVELVASYADILQIGARTMQNTPLLIEVGKAGKPVLLKHGWSTTLEEWLCAAEYIALQGHLEIILCERGVRTFAFGDDRRHALDVNFLPAVRERTFLPLIVDPSHAAGRAELVPGAARAAIAAGADGLIIEILGADTDPGCTLCDGMQSIRPSELRDIVSFCRHVRPASVEKARG
jgi:3-deoxy-7-phosphoheptulonate synthase